MYQLNLRLPDWIDNFLAGYSSVIPSMETQMRFVLDLTKRNIHEKTGGPFGAAVFEKETGKLVSVGVNVVVVQNCSAAHAEMMALMLAQKKIGHYDLADVRFPAHRLVTSGKMCAMCLGNVCWSGIKEVVSSAEPEDVERITGFDEGPTPIDYNDQLKLRGINLVPELLREQGKEVLQLYVDQNGQVYNATR